ncbi:aliphatic sulfonate ABC transporter substrate-binding protein [uncultured Megasphaera sp.]|uniref:aliphatic sulfonate ABC transporter substrate-binding protein n=1 Tax=uncultured Megasphaera sp. TaxID=165188 RepID=UPI00265965C9|nr:aliphatic sulfonate ABC transporter substrate-binding protein [uncultured Megasphaera sp.]
MKKWITVLAVAALAIGVLSGCGSSSEDKAAAAKAPITVTEGKDEGAVLRIAAQPYPLYTSVYVAHNLGYIDEELSKVGAKATWTEFKSGPLVNEAVAANEADLGFMADLPAIIAKSQGHDISIVSNIAYGEKALAVLVPSSSSVTSVADLKGKKVAYAKGSYAQHLLAQLLEKEGLTLDDVQTVNLNAAEQVTALTTNEVDAIVIWEQYITKLTSAGQARVLADGTGIKRGNMINYFVTSYADKHPLVVLAYLRALNRANELIKSDPDKAAEVTYQNFGISKEEMKKVLKNLTFTTALNDDDIKAITEVKDFSKKVGIIQDDVNMDNFIDKRYIDALSKK